MTQLINFLNVANRVFLKGYKDNLDEYYRKIQIFAFTSTSDGFPNVLGEEMSTGVACISFDCVADPADLIDDGVNGLLVPGGDIKQYKQKLRLLMEDAELRDKFDKAAVEKIQNNFSIEMIGNKYLEFINGN